MAARECPRRQTSNPKQPTSNLIFAPLRAPSRTTLPPPRGGRPVRVTTMPAMRDPRLEKLADVLVNYSTGVRPGQLVRITAPSVASPLVAELYRRVVAAGGHPMVRLSPDELSEIFLKNATEEQLRYI